MDLTGFDMYLTGFETTTAHKDAQKIRFNIDCFILKAPFPVGKLGFIFWCMPFLSN